MANNKSKAAGLWASISMGIFLIGYNVGTGSITAMASAGSDYGMSLTWALVLSCVFAYAMLIAFSRYTMQTGESSMQSFRKHFGAPVTIFIIVALLSAEITSSMGLMGVSAEVVKEWSRPLTPDGEGFNEVIVAIVFAILLGFLCWKGEQGFFEKILAIFVALMGIAFIATMFMVVPSAEEIIKGLKPSIPEGDNSFVVVASMVGTTMGAILFVARSVLVKDKGWTMADMKIQKRDALISVGMMFVLSFAIMVCAAGAMRGEHIENAIQMVGLVEPIAGKFATSLFVVGIVAAALSSLFPILLLAPWLISDYLGEKSNMRSTRSRILMYVVLLCSLCVPVFGWRPVKVVLISQTLTMVATPLTILFMTILLNRKDLMGDNRPSVLENIIYTVVFLFTLTVAVIGVSGLFQMS